MAQQCKAAVHYASTICTSSVKKRTAVYWYLACIMSLKPGAQSTDLFVHYASRPCVAATVRDIIMHDNDKRSSESLISISDLCPCHKFGRSLQSGLSKVSNDYTFLFQIFLLDSITSFTNIICCSCCKAFYVFLTSSRPFRNIFCLQYVCLNFIH